MEDFILERIADLICGDDKSIAPIYRSSTYLTRFFESAGLPRFKHDGSTRKWWVVSCLNQCSDDEMRQVILTLASPKTYKGQVGQIELVLKSLNEVLNTEGLSIGIDGVKPVLLEIEPRLSDSIKEEEQENEVNIRVRAQLLRNLYTQLLTVLRTHSDGYLLILSDQVDEFYVKLRKSIESILQGEGFEDLAAAYPKDSIPNTLHSLGEDADIYWESCGNVLNVFTGEIIEFCVSVGADKSELDSAIKTVLASHDKFIESFQKGKRQTEEEWLKSAEQAGKQYQDKSTDKKAQDIFVNVARLGELRAIHSTVYDLTKLLELCDELNKAFTSESYMAVAMLVRAILDHVPPIFACKTFAEVANNYGAGSKSFKQSMANLETSSRRIADAHLHTQIRQKEVLPNKTQINFSHDLDVLLAEIVRLLK